MASSNKKKKSKSKSSTSSSSRKKDRGAIRRKRNEKNIYPDRIQFESTSINDMASQLGTFIKYANERIDEILASGYYSNSLEKIFDENGEYAFSMPKNPTKSDIYRISTQINAFLTSPDATVTGAKLTTQEMSRFYYKSNKTFGKQDDPSWTYNVKLLDYAKAKLAFSVYRSIESTKAGAIYGESKLAYGSENLIIDIYDAIESQHITDFDELVRTFQDKIDDFIIERNKELDFRIQDIQNINAIAGVQYLSRSTYDFINDTYF